MSAAAWWPSGSANNILKMTAKKIRCETISWFRVHQLSRRLAYLILASGYRPDKIIAIGRGGYVPARILCDYLDIYQLSSIRVEHYKRGTQREPLARVVDPLRMDLSGQRLLIVDDVSDTGDTFEAAIEHVQERHPEEIKTAVLHHKISATFIPDYISHTVIKWRWLIYPWALMEDLTGFVRQMETPPQSIENLAERLKADYSINISRQVLEDVIALLDL